MLTEASSKRVKSGKKTGAPTPPAGQLAKREEGAFSGLRVGA